MTRIPLALSVLFVLAPRASAQVTCFSDENMWTTTVGAPTATEDFQTFAADASFEGQAVTTAVGTLAVVSGGLGFRNFVDVPPLLYTDNNGTSHASCFTNFDEPTVFHITLTQPATAFGCHTYGAFGGGGEGLEIAFFNGAAQLGVCAAVSTGAEFIGCTSTQAFNVIEFRSATLNPGQGGEGFGLDDVRIVAGCPTPVTYCTAGTTANGCVPSIASSGTPSAAATSGFTVSVASLEGQRAALFFYGLSGTLSLPWATGSTSFLCVKPPTQRSAVANTGGNVGQCNGALALDFNTFLHTPGVLGQPFAGGETVWVQAWFRDPPAPKTTNLSNALRFAVCP
jgi:hypothetical protein